MERLALAADEACQLSASMGEDPALGWEDALALELLAWFKRDFFQWVSAPPCGGLRPPPVVPCSPSPLPLAGWHGVSARVALPQPRRQC